MINLKENLNITPTPKQMEQLQGYVELLLKWNKSINLIGRSTEAEVWKRHILDSAQLVPHLGTAKKVLDVGCGAGLPAVVLAILGSVEITACDKVAKKTDFILEVRQRLGLQDKLQVFNQDVKGLYSQGVQFDVITARAVAPLVDLVGLTNKLLLPKGKYLFLKGASFESELIALNKKFRMTHKTFSSITYKQGEIIELQPLL